MTEKKPTLEYGKAEPPEWKVAWKRVAIIALIWIVLAALALIFSF